MIKGLKEKKNLKKHNIGECKWPGYRFDEKRLNCDWFDFYPEIDEGNENNVRSSVCIYFRRSGYSNFLD